MYQDIVLHLYEDIRIGVKDVLRYLRDHKQAIWLHAVIQSFHEASQKCIWLRSVIQHIQEICGLSSEKMLATTIYEDSTACIAQLKEGYIKGDRTNHISPKFFFTHDLQRNGDINIQQIHSCDNLSNFLTKSLPSKTFEQLIWKIGLHRLRNDYIVEGEK